MPLPAEVLIRLFGPIIDYGQQTSLSASSYVLQPKHLLTEQWEKNGTFKYKTNPSSFSH